MNRKRPEPIVVPKEGKPSYILTNSGLFSEGDLTISKEGLLISSPASTRQNTRPSSANSVGRVAEEDSASSKEDYDASSWSPQDFQEQEVIGQGSSGVAKKVLHRPTGQVMVLKVMQFDASSDSARKNITTELRTLWGACHPNIVKYHQAFFDNGAITIVMEFMDRGSLADLLKRHKKLDERFIAEIARQIVAGLSYLHKELKVIHRDIKPSNLLLHSNGDLKITDFGVSGQLTSSVANAMSWVGTVTYMSPERIKGDAYSFDSDVWSLGLTLMECALGRYPYAQPGDCSGSLGFWELLEHIVEQAPPSLPRNQFSPEFCDFMSKCLQKDTKSRPSVQELSKHAFLKLYKGTSLAELLQQGD